MAQLIKIQDYISRYEIDIYQYSSRYVRLKKQRWDRLKFNWQTKGSSPVFQAPMEEQIDQSIKAMEDDDWLKEEKVSIFNPLKKLFKKKSESKEDDVYEFEQRTSEILEHKHQSLEDVKKDYLNALFNFQLSWASSTIRSYSFLDKDFYSDSRLQYFLQHFPDNFLLMYKPIFQIKNAPLEMEVLLLSPTEVWCINVIESKGTKIYTADKGRYWDERDDENNRKKIINPLISLNKMESVVRSIFKSKDIEFPIKKVVLCKNGFIEPAHQPMGIDYIDFRTYEKWYQKLRKHSAPVKHIQLKAAGALLSHCQSTYVKRSEWKMEGLDDENEWEDDNL